MSRVSDLARQYLKNNTDMSVTKIEFYIYRKNQDIISDIDKKRLEMCKRKINNLSFPKEMSNMSFKLDDDLTISFDISKILDDETFKKVENEIKKIPKKTLYYDGFEYTVAGKKSYKNIFTFTLFIVSLSLLILFI